jgi:hypothetical protein
VCHADVGNDADIRAREAGERFDFTGVVHADFPDANLIGAFGATLATLVVFFYANPGSSLPLNH